jgi:hypothetical protein
VAQLLHGAIQDFQIAAPGVVLSQFDEGLQYARELIFVARAALCLQPFIDLRHEFSEALFLLVHLSSLLPAIRHYYRDAGGLAAFDHDGRRNHLLKYYNPWSMPMKVKHEIRLDSDIVRKLTWSRLGPK